jgi:hypothetical protein
MAQIIKVNFSGKHPIKSTPLPLKEPAPIYQFKISLAFSDPLIWRRLQIDGNCSLDRFHTVLQLCMGWSDIHTHRFLIGKVFYAPSQQNDIFEKTGERNESDFRLVDLENDMKWCFTYVYDFGDGWEHEIELEESIPAKAGLPPSVLLAGERACPPENIGGIPGYYEFLTIINNPQDKRYKMISKWYGADRFNPDLFDIRSINKALKRC